MSQASWKCSSKQTHTHTWLMWPHCCPSTRLPPDSGGSVNSPPVVEDKHKHPSFVCTAQILSIIIISLINECSIDRWILHYMVRVCTCDTTLVRCSSAGKSAGPLQTADRSRCVREWRGRVFSTSSKPVEPSALWERHTDFRWPVP